MDVKALVPAEKQSFPKFASFDMLRLDCIEKNQTVLSGAAFSALVLLLFKL